MRPVISPNPFSEQGELVQPYPEPEEPVDEVLAGGGLPRWLQVGGVLLAVTVLVMVLVTKLGGPAPEKQALPTPIPTGPPKPAFDRSAALDVALGGNHQWSIEGHRLVRSGPTNDVRSLSLAALHLPARSVPVLALDEPHGVIWLVVTNAAPAVIVEIDADSVRVVRTSTWKQLVSGAAAVDGYLYLATALGTAEMSPSQRHPRLVPGMSGVYGPVAADVAHHQVVALDTFEPEAVYSFRHGGKPRQSQLRLPMVDGTIAVSGGNIWVGGFGYRGAMLYRIDPATLLPIAGGRAPMFGPGAEVLAGGRSVVWVRSGDESSDLLVCMGAATGRIEQRFHIIGDIPAVASTGGYAVLATAQGVLNLSLAGCPG